MQNLWRTAPVDAVRGALIGVAEVVPGVSGGTIALVVGVYATLINSLGHVVDAARALFADVPRGRGTGAARSELSKVAWDVTVPLGLGMVLAVVVAAQVLEPLLETYPERSRAVFAGLILASVTVPVGMIWRSARGRHVALGAVAAIAAFVLTGLPASGAASPSLPVVALAASVAICALVLPGVSGSFFLLTVGIYQPTISAVNDRDLPYLATFAVGALAGLGLFVKILQWLLEHRHTATLAVMAGLMVGSLRALWPWQGPDRQILAPSGEVGLMVLLAVVGALVVLGLILLQSRISRREETAHGPTPPLPRSGGARSS